MQEFGSFTTPVDTRSFDARVSNLTQDIIDSQPEEVVDLSTVEALLQTLITGQIVTNAQLSAAVLELMDRTDDELRLRELKKIQFHLADMTDNFIEEAD